MPFCPQCGDEFQPGITECPDCRMALTDHSKKVLKIKSTPLNLVTVAVYDYAEQAYVSKNALNSAGIRAWITDEKTLNANWFLNTALGGIKLKVEKDQAEVAERLLKTIKPPVKTAAEDSSQTCPQCGSSAVRFELFNLRWVFLSMLLASIPLPFMSKKWRCSDCGNGWPAKND